jgi:predicted Zn-dependent protease
LYLGFREKQALPVAEAGAAGCRENGCDWLLNWISPVLTKEILSNYLYTEAVETVSCLHRHELGFHLELDGLD